MKRKILIASAVLAVACFGLVGLAVARPELFPPWVRLKLARPAAVKDDSGLFCAEHGVPEKFCTLCHEELKGKLLLCKEHGDIPEDICTLCHPEVEAKHKIEMCPKGHGLPKHFCTECRTIQAASTAPDDGWCTTHGKPEAFCEECQKDPKAHDAASGPKVCRQPLPMVKLATPKLVRQVGIQTAPAVEEEHSHRLQANAEVAYDANHFAEVTPRVLGVLREVRTDLGQKVHRGDVLATVDSAEISTWKSQYLAAQAVVAAQAEADRTIALVRKAALPKKAELEAVTALIQAQATSRDAEQKLRNLGFTGDELGKMAESKDTSNVLEVTALIDGVIVARHAVRGEAVQPTSSLFTIADISRMWLWIDVYEGDMEKVKLGQEVELTVSGAGPDAVASKGQVTWIGTEVNPTTRTTRIRAELANPDGRLRANQFGLATLHIGHDHTAIVVPKAAVQTHEKTELVFLPLGDGVFRPQRVLTKPTDRPGSVEVTWGLKAGDQVVTEGAFWLKTEIMRGAIGAGCCE